MWHPQEGSAVIEGRRALPGGSQGVVARPRCGGRRMGGAPGDPPACTLLRPSAPLCGPRGPAPPQNGPRSPGRRGGGAPCRPARLESRCLDATRSPLPPPLPLSSHSPGRLHPATSTPSCLSAWLALRPTSCVVAVSVLLLDILNPISLQKSPPLDLSPQTPSISSTFAWRSVPSVRERRPQAIRAARSQPKHTVLGTPCTSPRGGPPREPQVGKAWAWARLAATALPHRAPELGPGSAIGWTVPVC